MNLRILHWTESFWPRVGGAERFVQHLVSDQRRRGHQPLVITDTAASLPDEELIDHVRVLRFPFQATLASRDLQAIGALVVKVQARAGDFAPQLLHLHTSQPGAFFFLRVLRRLAIPSVYTTHDPMDTVSQHPMLIEILEKVSRIVAISPFMLRETLQRLPRAAPKAQCLAVGLPWPDRPAVRVPQAPNVLAAGRLTAVKGFDVLIRASAAVLCDRPDATFTIAGDGEARADLEALAESLGVSRAIRFVGWQSPAALMTLVDEAMLVAVPSRWQEPFGLIALEAMQRQRPVVASHVGGLADLVRDQETGRLVPPDNPDALAAALLQILMSHDTAQRLGEAGADRARADFDWRRCVDAYDRVYASIL